MAHPKSPLKFVEFASCSTQGTGDQPSPDWLRVSEACAYCRVSKPKLYDLLNRGLVRSLSLAERGQIKGTRLVSFHSLKAFLESRASGGEQLNAPTAESAVSAK
jgi:hypothetical protein